MSYNVYKVLHLTGVFMVFLSLGGAIVRSQVAQSNGGTKKLVGIVNGIGLLISFVAGFGLMAKLGIGFDGWIITKLLIWFAFGGSLALVNRKNDLATPVLVVAILLGALAAYLAIAKPF